MPRFEDFAMGQLTALALAHPDLTSTQALPALELSSELSEPVSPNPNPVPSAQMSASPSAPSTVPAPASLPEPVNPNLTETKQARHVVRLPEGCLHHVSELSCLPQLEAHDELLRVVLH